MQFLFQLPTICQMAARDDRHNCQLSKPAPLEIIVQYDLEHFKYPVAIADAIWEALLNHIRQVIREQRHIQKCA